jgi:DNA-binding transcriptional MerR regulator
MSDGLLSIGMFSRASSLSIKMLRAYHASGLLEPAHVDPQTGYRMYAADQLADAAIILRLRDLDLPLEQVGEVLRARDPEATRRVLAAHRDAMQARLVAAERIVAELRSDLAPRTHTPVHVRFEETAPTVRVVADVAAAELWPWLESTFARLSHAIEGAGGTPVRSRGALYDAELADDWGEHVEALVPVAAPVPLGAREDGLSTGELPAAWTAVLVHAGDYDAIGETYRALGAWVARHAEPTGECIREWYVVGAADGVAPAAYRTEIAWPIAPPRGSVRPAERPLTLPPREAGDSRQQRRGREGGRR